MSDDYDDVQGIDEILNDATAEPDRNEIDFDELQERQRREQRKRARPWAIDEVRDARGRVS